MRSDKIKKGITAAPQRALLHALGVTEKELEKLFDQTGVDCLEIELGMLVRRKTENGCEWLIEI